MTALAQERHGRRGFQCGKKLQQIYPIMKTKPLNKPTAAGQRTANGKVHSGKKARFKISVPQAKSVILVGSFTEWETRPIALVESTQGLWEAEIELPAGRHEYLFLTDQGWWLPDPEAVESVPNPFGGWNSVIQIDL
jgi:1,4-alpha-glucan branching enzyme